MQKFSTLTLISALTFSGVSMAATSTDGFYIEALGGIAMGNTSALNSQEKDEISISSAVTSSDKSALWGAAIGYILPNLPLSLELQALRINSQDFKMGTLYNDGYHEWDTLSVRSNVYLANLIYALPAYQNFTPFFGAGIGVAQNKVAGNFISTTEDEQGNWADNSKTQFAYDFTAGVNYQFTPNLGISLAYQYLSLGKLNTQSTVGDVNQTLFADKYTTNNVILGLNYTF